MVLEPAKDWNNSPAYQQNAEVGAPQKVGGAPGFGGAGDEGASKGDGKKGKKGWASDNWGGKKGGSDNC